MKRILFISHQSSITGGTILLLHFLKELKKSRPDIAIDILIRRNGVLVPEFRKVGDVVVLDALPGYPNGFFKRAYWKIRKIIFKETFESHIEKETYDEYCQKRYVLIFSNTITNGDVLEKLSAIKCPKVSYIHELEYSIKAYFDPKQIQLALAHSNYFLVPSNLVGENLIKKHYVSREKVRVLKYFVPEVNKYSEGLSSEFSLDKYGIQRGTFLIGVVGTSSWLKGVDLFVQIARLMKERSMELNYRFLWLGADKNMIDYKNACYDMNQLDMADTVFFVETLAEPIGVMRRMDIVLLPSREDSYPLVAIEAAMLSKPVIYFNNAGGISELLGERAGIKIPYLALDKMVDAIVFLMKNPDERNSLGIRARGAYLCNHTRDFAYEDFEALIDSFILGSGLLKQ